MKRLTQARIKSITKPGRYGDGNCLFLFVARGGSKSWVQRMVIQGQRRDLGLGGWPVVSLDEARAWAAHNRKLARFYKMDPAKAPAYSGPIYPGPMAPGPGPAPTSPAPAPRVPTLQECTERTHRANLPRWRAEKHAHNWLASMERYVFPTLGSMPVDQITGRDVLAVIEPIWGTQTDTARRVRQRIRTVLGWAMAHGYVERNAADSSLDGALPAIQTNGQHFKALPHKEVAAALQTVESTKAGASTKLGLRFLVLTAARSGEARGARWDEVDWDAKTWTVPGSRMKAGKAHRVPLSDAAVKILQQAKALADSSSGLVFPSARGGELSNMAWTKLLRTTGLAERATVHGFRSSFRDWCAETGQPREIAEAALAHVVGGVEGAYFRSDLFEARRALMQGWANYLEGGGKQSIAWDTASHALLASGLAGWASKQENQQQAKQAS